MIRNERQLGLTRAAIERFEHALAALSEQSVVGSANDQALRSIHVAGIKSELEVLRRQVAEYDALRSGTVRRLRLQTLAEFPSALIKARIVAGLTEAELADRLGWDVLAVETFEATKYESADFARLVEVATALGIRIGSDVALPSPSNRAA